MIKRNHFIVLFILVMVVVLFTLKSCLKEKPQETINVTEKTGEENVLQSLKSEEEKLIALYDRSDICSKEWTKEYKEVAAHFENIEYIGNNTEIHTLVKMYQEYGKQLSKISILIEEFDYEEAQIALEELKATAQINESELNQLYEKFN